jgi:hypothetical protein
MHHPGLGNGWVKTPAYVTSARKSVRYDDRSGLSTSPLKSFG